MITTNFIPESGNDIHWGAIDPGTQKPSWMEQIVSNCQNTNVYNCPANVQLPPDMRGPFNYRNRLPRGLHGGISNDAPVKWQEHPVSFQFRFVWRHLWHS